MKYMVGAYWPARKDSLESCSNRLFQFFRGLAKSSDDLSRWFETGRSRADALKASIDVGSTQCLAELLRRGQHRRDMDNSVMPQLGYHVGLWNGAAPGQEAGLSITCGMSTTRASMGNCVALNLPPDLKQLADSDAMSHLLGAVVRSWEPDWAGVMSDVARRVRGFTAKRPFVDWMIYLKDKDMLWNRQLPLPASVCEIEGIGGVIITTQARPPDPHDASDMAHVATVTNVLGLNSEAERSESN